jgi:hypothetical protein
MRRVGPRLALLVLAILAMLLQAGSVPHLHGGKGPGLYNAEHDLSLLAALAAHGLPGDPPRLVVEAVSAAVPPLAPSLLAARLCRAADSRAPPRA